MKTYRASSGIDHRLSIYGERSKQQDSVGKSAAKRSGRGVLKRLSAAISRSDRLISRACRSTSKALTPLVERAKYAIGSKVSRLQSAVASVSSRNSHAPKHAGAPAQALPARELGLSSDAQAATKHFKHFYAVNDIRKLVAEFPVTDPDVPAAVGAINALSKDLSEAGHALDGVTYDQVTNFLERAQACNEPRLTWKARDFLLRAQSTAPEAINVGPYVNDPERDREWSSTATAQS